MSWPGSYRSAAITGEDGKVVFEQKDIEVPEVLVDAGHQRRRLEVLPRHARHARSARRSVRKLVGRVVDTITALGRARAATSPPRRTRQAFHAELTHLLLRQKAAFNSPGLVQRRRRGAPAVLGLLHQLRRGLDGARSSRWPRPRACSSSTAPARAPTSPPIRSSQGAARGRRHRLRPGLLHEGLRRLRRRHQERRQDPPRGEDGHPQRRPPGHRWSSSAARSTRRRRPGRSSTPATTAASTARPTRSIFFQNSNNSVRVTDEFMKAVVDDREWHDPRGARRAMPWTPTGRATCCREISEAALAVRRPGPAVRHHHQRLAHLRRTRRASTRRNPCSEYMFLDDTACNLASLNLMHFRDVDGELRRRGVQARGGRDAHWRRRSSSASPSTPRSRSRRTATTTGRSAWATPTSARC